MALGLISAASGGSSSGAFCPAINRPRTLWNAAKSSSETWRAGLREELEAHHAALHRRERPTGSRLARSLAGATRARSRRKIIPSVPGSATGIEQSGALGDDQAWAQGVDGHSVFLHLRRQADGQPIESGLGRLPHLSPWPGAAPADSQGGAGCPCGLSGSSIRFSSSLLLPSDGATPFDRSASDEGSLTLPGPPVPCLGAVPWGSQPDSGP